MPHLFLIIAILAVVGLLWKSIAASSPKGPLTAMSNIGEGVQPAVRTLYADAVVGRNLLVKHGSDARHYALAGAADIPIGFSVDAPDVIGDGVGIAFLGLQDEGALGVASGVVAVDDWLVPDAGGKVRKLPIAAGTYYIIGRATSATAADGDPIEYTSCFPIQRIVP